MVPDMKISPEFLNAPYPSDRLKGLGNPLVKSGNVRCLSLQELCGYESCSPLMAQIQYSLSGRSDQCASGTCV